MPAPIFLLAAAATFGVCFLFDKLFTKYFRSQSQHRSGLSVRYNKRYAIFGLILVILGIVGLFTSISGGVVLLLGGSIVLAMGIGLIVFYMTFGIFYDADSFLLTTFGKKSVTYRFADIAGQKLYMVQGGSILVELHLNDGNALTIQSSMEGAYPFLDHAFFAWCRQKGLDPKACDFHDPANSLWFQSVEED